jgi:hypothetical protein
MFLSLVFESTAPQRKLKWAFAEFFKLLCIALHDVVWEFFDA